MLVNFIKNYYNSSYIIDFCDKGELKLEIERELKVKIKMLNLQIATCDLYDCAHYAIALKIWMHIKTMFSHACFKLISKIILYYEGSHFST